MGARPRRRRPRPPPGRPVRVARLLAARVRIQLLATPSALLTPVPLMIAVDSVVAAEPFPGILTLLVPTEIAGSGLRLLVFAAALQVGIVLSPEPRKLGKQVLTAHIGERLTLGMRERLFRHAQRLSPLFHDLRGTVDSTYRL